MPKKFEVTITEGYEPDLDEQTMWEIIARGAEIYDMWPVFTVKQKEDDVNG